MIEDIDTDSSYRGNQNLKPRNIKIKWTQHRVQEFIKCKEDPMYFICNYCKIVSLDDGIIKFVLRDYQKEILDLIINNSHFIGVLSRQSGKSQVVAAYILHYVTFNENKTAAILANKADSAREIISRIQSMYELLPNWLKQGVLDWNKGSMNFENGSRILGSSTSSSAIRGKSINLLLLDEYAFVPTNIAEEFMRSVYPTIASGKNTKIIIISTPQGLNHFYKLWTDSKNKRNEYVGYFADYSVVPNRDENWKQKTISNIGQIAFNQEFGCDFIGSTSTLIDSQTLSRLTYQDPILYTENLKIYNHPEPGHTYIITSDISEGIGLDYTVINVSDISSIPFKQVAVYRSNLIDPNLLPEIEMSISKKYNNAYILIEYNAIGMSVAQSMWQLGEENLVWTMTTPTGQQISNGSHNSVPGLKITKTTKRTGCQKLKTLIESDSYTIQDFDTLSEISKFCSKNGTFQGQDNSHDDIVMTLVHFAWLSNQPWFDEVSQSNSESILKNISRRNIQDIDQYFGRYEDNILPQVLNTHASRLPFPF